MNALEIDMLWKLKFSLGVTREEYDECSRALVIIDKVDAESLLLDGADSLRRGVNQRDSSPMNQDIVSVSLKANAGDLESYLDSPSASSCCSAAAHTSPSSQKFQTPASPCAAWRRVSLRKDRHNVATHATEGALEEIDSAYSSPSSTLSRTSSQDLAMSSSLDSSSSSSSERCCSSSSTTTIRSKRPLVSEGKAKERSGAQVVRHGMGSCVYV